MPQKVLKFSGINRRVNEFQGSGTCEELINLRPTSSGLEVVRPKKVKFDNADYEVYTHVFADKSLFIGVVPGNTFGIYLISDEGNVSLIDEIDGDGPDYSIAFMGNQMLFYHNTSLYAYAYKNDGYVRIDAALPDNLDISYSVNAGYGYGQEVSLESSDPKSNEFKNAAQENWSAALGQNSRVNEIFGPVLVAFNFSMTDGTEFWTNKWIPINPFLYLPYGDEGKNMIYYEDGDVKKFVFNSYGISFTISQNQISTSGIDNMVSHVNVYATRPVFPYDPDTMSAVTGGTHDRAIYANVASVNDSGLMNQLLYFQKSIPISDIEDGDVTFTLDFGETQAGEKVLEVDNGPVRRSGRAVSYNNRAHVYDSYATLVPQSVVCLSNAGDAFYERDAYVYLDVNGDTLVINTTALVPIYDTSTTHKICCCYPDARAKKILINTSGSYYCTIDLVQSSRYNFAWGEAKYPGNQTSSSNIKVTSNVFHEANTINVSGRYNPFVYPVEYSYSFGGRILDVATSFLPISSTQVGQYPLTVFTTSGIFALEQGNGSALYGNITPLQPLVIENKTTTTPYGTFFISGKSLYLLSGREVTDVSYVLNGERELNLRDLDSYNKLCCSGSSLFFNFSSLLSSKDFEEYITDARLTYDQLQNELYISSTDESIAYSYVFNLDTKTYHKIARKYLSSENGARYVAETIGSNTNIVDLFVEEKDNQPILLQSRPLQLEAFFTHIQRLILLADANLIDSQHLCISVFASDNLYDWKCIISSQKHDVALRQIRTNRAAKSYRDYVILITGIVDTNTDISELIADYTVVNRRLG